VREIVIVGFIDSDLPVLTWNKGKRKKEKLKRSYLFSCVETPRSPRSVAATVLTSSFLLLTFPGTSFALFPLHDCHPAALQSIPRRAQCERKQLPNRPRHRLLGDARRSAELKSTAVPMAFEDR